MSPTQTSTRNLGTLDALRLGLGRGIRIVCTVLAAMLAVGAVLVSLRHDVSTDNPLVRLVVHVDDAVDGPFNRQDGVFAFTGTDAIALEALTNWGVAALVYLLLGRLLGRIIRPRARRGARGDPL